LNPLQIALSVRSDFSLGESSFQVGKIVDRAKELGYTHIALADYMSVASMPFFAEKCKKAGITPIVGCTIQVVDDPTAKLKDRENGGYRLKVYVKSDKGMQSLFAALTKSLTPEHYYYHARLGLADVLALEDVIVTTGDIYNLWHREDATSISAQLSARFGRDYIIELVALDTPLFNRLNRKAFEVGDAYLQTMIVTRPAFYATPEDANATDVLRAISSNTSAHSIFLPRPYVRNMCLLSAKDMVEECKKLRDQVGSGRVLSLVENAKLIPAGCSFVFKKLQPTMPKMADDEFTALLAAVKAGWGKRFGREVWGHAPSREDLDGPYRERLAFELGVLKKMGFSGYFLLVQDIVNWSKENGVRVGPGRGSVGGSLVAYLMGITDIDPIRFGLLFERFINPDRVDLPDADLDFMSGKRHMVIDYIRNKWGHDRVAGIVNFSTLGPASALRDTARLHDLDPWEYACSKQMEKEHGVSLSLTESAERVPDIEKFKNERPILWDYALRLEGANRSLSQHAAGVVVAGEPVVNRAVVSTRGDKDGSTLPIVQWDKTKVEDFGLIKIDILGLSTLDMVETALEYIRERHHKTIDMLSLPLDDKRVLEAFAKGDTTGVFQFEGGGMKNLLKQLALGGPLTFDDICAATALFRPGPLDAGLCDRYVQVKQGATRPYYDHPKLEPVLSETYGVMAYQEQVMQVCRVLAGFTPGEADGVRKAIGKKDAEKMAEFKDKFIKGCVDHSEWEEHKAESLWTSIEGYAAYSFNKSHSYEYSLISWVTMWLKVYYPAEFFAAAMTVVDKDEKLAGLVLDAQGKKLQVLPPDLNRSSARVEIEGEDKLYAPLQAIKGISSGVAAAIEKLRAHVGGRFTWVPVSTKEVPLKTKVKIVEVPAHIRGLDQETQKEVLGRTAVNSKHLENLEKVGALHSITGEGKPATHPDRLKDRIALVPGFTVEMVRPDRELNAEHLAKIKITRLVEEARACEGCSLKGKPHPLPRMGDKPRFMMVFDTPSWEEERAGKMLEGKASEAVKAALKDVGLRASDGYYTSLVKVSKPKEQKALTNEQIIGCSKYLEQEIEILKPPIIIAMGSNAVRWFAPGIKGTPADLAGKVIYRADLDATVIFGIHPGSVFHDPSKVRLIENTFEKLGELLT
jgi:DNA polymerase-3 subunit alpha